MKRETGITRRLASSFSLHSLILRSRRSFAFIGRLGGHHNIAGCRRNERPGRGPWEVAGARGRPIIAAVARRVHVSRLSVGEITLDPAQAHHARDVLRLTEGTPVEV